MQTLVVVGGLALGLAIGAWASLPAPPPGTAGQGADGRQLQQQLGRLQPIQGQGARGPGHIEFRGQSVDVQAMAPPSRYVVNKMPPNPPRQPAPVRMGGG